MSTSAREARLRRHRRVRGKVSGTADRPRLVVFRSNKGISAQLIDDDSGKTLAGASWIGEYGDPKIPAERKMLMSYSPYQNLKAGQKYPKVLIETSTKDDRVHPAHARKAAARLKEYGYDFLYYENIDGGHAAAANLNERALRTALEFTYLQQRLMD